MIVVTDTSVVLNLCFLRQEALLTKLFGQVLAPPEVLGEFQRLVAVDDRFKDLIFSSFIELKVGSQIPLALLSTTQLQQGEIAAISLALEVNANAVLMDERAGRTVATALGLNCMGLIGVLLQGKASGLISSVAPLLERLSSQARFWISPSLKSKILREAGE